MDLEEELMTNTSKKGRWMFAGFVAIIVTVFSCLLAFLIVTILPKVKTHSNYYLLKETTEETESTGPSLDDLVNSKTELYFSGDKYYIIGANRSRGLCHL